MRVLALADRLTARGGAYWWMLGVLDALWGRVDLRLAVGDDDSTVRAACPTVVVPGLEARVAAPADLRGVVDGFRPDVVHVHNVVNPVVLEWAASQGRALLTVQDHRFFCPTRGKWTLAGEVCRRPLARETCAGCFDDEPYFREVLALTERRLAAARRLPLTVLSRYMRDELVAAGVDPASVHVVPPFVYGLDREAAASGPPCVLFVGRLVAAKGVGDAVAAWRLSGVDLPLVVAGSGPLRSELVSLAAGRGLDAPGWLNRAALAAAYRRARALLLPSRWQEPFGIVGLEALAFGVPVAAWDSGGVAEWHKGPGLVPWGDVTALARALAEAVERSSHPGRHPEPSLRGYERAEAVEALLTLYEEIA
jgi:glycosyltransferase involved in cell wall biosynthesis